MLQLLPLATVVFSSPKQHINPKANSYPRVNLRNITHFPFCPVFSDGGCVHLCSQTHPHRARKGWEKVVHMDPELFSSKCKIWGNLGASLSRVPSLLHAGFSSGQGTLPISRDSQVPSHFILQHALMSAPGLHKAVTVCWQEWEQSFRFKREFSASAFLVLESLLRSPIELWCIRNHRVFSTYIFSHKLVSKIIRRYGSFPCIPFQAGLQRHVFAAVSVLPDLEPGLKHLSH